MHQLLNRAIRVALPIMLLASSPAHLHGMQAQSADAVLQHVIDQLPAEHITASGTMFVRRRRGIPQQTYHFTMDADWRPHKTKVTYTIKDQQDTPLESLTFQPNAETIFTYRSGPELTSAALPNLTANISSTDVSWLDLSLYFLWWRGAAFVGVDEVRGLHCNIIEVAAPDTDAEGVYAKVRLWISSEQGLLLQAEGFNEAGRPIRRFWVQSVSKVDEQWMIQTMEIQQTNRDQRTRLHVVDIETKAGTQP